MMMTVAIIFVLLLDVEVLSPINLISDINRKDFAQAMKNPEQRDEMVQRLATRSKAAKGDQTSEQAGVQQNSTRNSKNELSAQSQQGQQANAQFGLAREGGRLPCNQTCS